MDKHQHSNEREGMDKECCGNKSSSMNNHGGNIKGIAKGKCMNKRLRNIKNNSMN